MRRSSLVLFGLAALGCRGIFAPELADGGNENDTDGTASTDVDSTSTTVDTSDTPESPDTLDAPDTVDSPDTFDAPEDDPDSDTDPICDADEVLVGDGCLGAREVVTADGTTHPTDIVLVHVAGDSGLDVVVAYQSGPPRYFTTLGGMLTPQGGPITTNSGHSLALFDADTNGQLDIAAGGTAGVTVVRVLNGGQFSDLVVLPFNSVADVAAGRLDGDRAADLAVSVSGSAIEIEFNQFGNFMPGPSLFTGDPGKLTLGDFDGNGSSDIAFVDQMLNGVGFFSNTGNFTYAGNFEFASVFGLAAGNIDGEFGDELIVTNPGSKTVTVLHIGGGFMLSASTYAVGEGPRQVALGDVDGDGSLDIVTANRESNNISILLGDGSGGFAPAINIGAPSTQQAEVVAVGDLDGNGKAEIVVGAAGTGQITMFGY